MRFAPLISSCALVSLVAGAALAAPPSLASYWPHEDGRQWLYDQHAETFFGVPSTVDNQARLHLDGTTTAPVGIAAQNLKGEVAWPPAATLATMGVPGTVTDPLLRRLWIARPDLRTRIERTASEEPCVSNGIPDWQPLLLTGGLAYRQTNDEIAAWRCDLANTRAWLWLTSDLTPGHETIQQLLPDLANDLFLHVTVGPIENVTVPAGTYANSLRIDYLVDYGESMCTSPTGEPLGVSHSKTTGYVHYALGVGPVDCFEEFTILPVSGACPDATGEALARATLKLHEPSVPATVSSWGAVKSIYRQ
jgi:hypothetical protein